MRNAAVKKRYRCSGCSRNMIFGYSCPVRFQAPHSIPRHPSSQQQYNQLRSPIIPLRLEENIPIVTTVAMVLDENSRFLHLPRELRDQIYTIVFESTRLSYGERFDLRSRIHGVHNGKHHIVPAPHSLALLSVCHQVHAETCNMWMKHVLFNFHDSRSMLNKLSSLPFLVPKIRHLRLHGLPLLRSLSGFEVSIYRGNFVFDMLRGLRLNTLTIVSNYSYMPDVLDYVAISKLINLGSGWQELYYIVPSFEVLGSMVNGSSDWFDLNDPFYGRRVRKESLLTRDNPRIGILVEMYWSHYEQPIDSVLDPQSRQLYDEYSALREDSILIKRRLLVHVKRADATQDSIRLRKAVNMQTRFGRRQWKTRRYSLSTKWGSGEDEEEDAWELGSELVSIPQVYDRYNDVNDI